MEIFWPGVGYAHRSDPIRRDFLYRFYSLYAFRLFLVFGGPIKIAFAELNSGIWRTPGFGNPIFWDPGENRCTSSPLKTRGAVPNGEMIKAQFGGHFRQNRRFYITRFISNPIRGTW